VIVSAFEGKGSLVQGSIVGRGNVVKPIPTFSTGMWKLIRKEGCGIGSRESGAMLVPACMKKGGS